jgi:hypothetical protein
MQIEQHKASLVALAIAPTLTEAGEYGADQFCWVARRDGQAGAPGCAARPAKGNLVCRLRPTIVNLSTIRLNRPESADSVHELLERVRVQSKIQRVCKSLPSL